jgi:hypothetical protein
MKQINEWSSATKNPFKAFKQLISCLQYGFAGRIKIVYNKDCENSIKIKNPLLDKHENWESGYAYPRSKEELENINWFNETEQDLTLNWDTGFFNEKGKETGIGVCKPVHRNPGYFIHLWRPINITIKHLRQSLPYVCCH